MDQPTPRIEQQSTPQGKSTLVLHEAKGTTLMATAYLLPDLRLEVEGPRRHQLLESWLVILDCG